MLKIHKLNGRSDWTRTSDPLLRKKVVDGTRMTVTRYSFAPGGRFPDHVHDQEQITYLLGGRLTLVVGGEPHPLTAGDLIVIPSAIPHQAVAGPEGAEVLSIVSPARTDGRGLEILERKED